MFCSAFDHLQSARHLRRANSLNLMHPQFQTPSRGATQTDHLALERQFSNTAAEHLPDDHLREFHSGHYTVKVSLCPKKKLYLFQASAGRPTNLQVIQLLDTDFTLDEGFSLEVGGFPAPETTRLFDHSPRRLAPGVFMWLPRFTMVERYIYQGMPKSRVGVVIRSTHSPERQLVDGKWYLVDARRLDLIDPTLTQRY